MTAMTLPAFRSNRLALWGAVLLGIVAFSALALALNVPYLASFIDWLVNRVPPNFALILRYAAPIAFGGLCGVMCERSGVVNIGIEGMMLSAAFVGFLAGAYAGPALGVPWGAVVGVAAAVLAAMLLSLLHAWLSITIKADQIISGTVINILALGGTAFFNQLLVSTTGLSGTPVLPRVDLPAQISTLPIVGPVLNGLFEQGPIAMSLLFIVLLLQFLLFRSRWGLRTRAVGEHPEAADTVGINVYLVRYRNVILGGAFAGLGGAFLTLEQQNAFQDGMTGGIGFIGLAAMIFGRWTPIGTFGAALLFGAVQSSQLTMRITPPAGDLGQFVATIPPQVYGMAPYVFTIIVLAGVMGRAVAPAADGIPYDKEART